MIRYFCGKYYSVVQKLIHEGLERILSLIVSRLNPNAMVMPGLLSMRGQLVFAIKQGLDGMVPTFLHQSLV